MEKAKNGTSSLNSSAVTKRDWGWIKNIDFVATVFELLFCFFIKLSTTARDRVSGIALSGMRPSNGSTRVFVLISAVGECFCTLNMCQSHVTQWQWVDRNKLSGERVRAKRHVSISPDWISSVRKYSNLVNTRTALHRGTGEEPVGDTTEEKNYDYYYFSSLVLFHISISVRS